MIEIAKFGGMVPRINPERLPDDAAQTAHNCDVTSGALAPLNVVGPFSAIHDGARLLAGVPASDVVHVPKPAAPSVGSIIKLCNPLPWLAIRARDWVSWVDPGSGTRTVVMARNDALTISNIIYTETGLNIVAQLLPKTYVFSHEVLVHLRGPKYQFQFLADPGVNGGPDMSVSAPIVAGDADPEIPGEAVPLIDRDGNVYGQWQVADVYGPKFDADVFNADFPAGLAWFLPPAAVMFTIDLNYAVASRRHYYYVQSALTDHDQEGPPSELSERILVKPGEIVEVTCPRPNGYTKNRLYRAGTRNADDFRLIDDINADTYLDTERKIKEDRIPPFGNPPASGDGLVKFLEGCFIHPAGFGVAAKDKSLYMSDIERLHAWPDEFTVPFEAPISAIGISGNTIIVFAGDQVYGVSGSHPERMDKFVISNTTPLLNKLGLCRIGQTWYFPTHDGLAAITASKVEIITREHFTRTQWRLLSPERMIARTADNSIFLDTQVSDDPQLAGNVVISPLRLPGSPIAAPNTPIGLRIDIEEGISAITTYTATSGGAMQWRSKRYWNKQETAYDYARVIADAYPVPIKVYAGRTGALAAQAEAKNDQPFPLIAANDGAPPAFAIRRFVSGPTLAAPFEVFSSMVAGKDSALAIGSMPHASEWEVEIGGNHLVRRIVLYDRKIITIDNDVRLTPENVESFQNIWLKFPDIDRFCAGVITAQAKDDIPIVFYPEGGADGPIMVTASTARPFIMPRTTRKASLWRINVHTARHIGELYLTRRRTAVVSDVIDEFNTGGVPPWLMTRYEFPDRVEPRSITVHASRNVVCNLYFDGSERPSMIFPAKGPSPMRIDAGKIGSLEFDFAGNDAHVAEVVVSTAAKARPMAAEPILLNGERSWRRTLFQFPDRGRIACLSVGANKYHSDDGSVLITVRLYGDGELVFQHNPVDGHVFQTGRGMPRAARWELDIEHGDAIVDTVYIAPEKPAQVSAGIIRELHPGTVPPWCYTRYITGEDTVFKSVLIDADPRTQRTVRRRRRARALPQTGGAAIPLQMRVYLDGAVAPSATVEVWPGVETLLRLPPCRTFEFDFSGLDHTVREVSVFARAAEPAGEGPVIMADRMDYRMVRKVFPAPASFACGNVVADRYDDISVSLYADGQLVYTLQPHGPGRRDFPRSLPKATVWDIDVATAGKIDAVTLYPRLPARADGPIRMDVSASPPQWAFSRFEFAGQYESLSAIVDSAAYPLTLAVYCDAAQAPATAIMINNKREIRIPLPRPCSSVEFSFHPNDLPVRELTVFPHPEAPISLDGFRMVNGPSYRALKVKLDGPAAFCAGLAACADYTSAKLDLYGDGALVHTETIKNGLPFLLPRTLPLASRWEIDVDAPGPVYDVLLAVRRETLLDSPVLHRVSQPGWFPEWLRERYRAPGKAIPMTAIVRAKNYPVKMRFYADGSIAPVETITIRNDREFALGLARPALTTFEFDFDGDDALIEEVLVFSKAPIEIGPGLTPLFGQASWLSVPLRFVDKGALAAFSVSASEYPIQAIIRADDKRVFSQRVTDALPVRLPMTLAERQDWEISLDGNGAIIHAVMLYAWTRETVGSAIHIAPQDGMAPAWLYTQYMMDGAKRWRSVMVKASRYPLMMDLYMDGGPPKGVLIIDGLELPLTGATGPGTQPCGELRFNFRGNDALVKELYLYAEEHVPVGPEGIIIRSGLNGATPWRNKTLRFADIGSFSVARAVLSNYTGASMRLVPDSGAATSVSIIDGNDFKLPDRMPNARDWRLDLQQLGEVFELHLIAKSATHVAGDLVRIVRSGEPFTWLDKRIIAARPVSWTVGRIISDIYPVELRIRNGRGRAYQRMVVDAKPFRVPSIGPDKQWRFDAVAGNAAAIKEVSLATSMARL